VDSATRRVLAWRELDAAVATATDDPHGGVVAANRAVQTVLQQLSSFCTEAAAAWQPAASSARKGAGLTVLGDEAATCARCAPIDSGATQGVACGV